MGAFRELVLWRKAHELVLGVYALKECFPADERYALWDQLRRAVVSVPANIAEGHGTGSDTLMQRHLTIASGSLAETRYLLLLAQDLGLLSEEQHGNTEGIAGEVSRILTTFRKRVAERIAQSGRKP